MVQRFFMMLFSVGSLALLGGCHVLMDISDETQPREICDNGLDDDGDGTVDCHDSDCEFSSLCSTNNVNNSSNTNNTNNTNTTNNTNNTNTTNNTNNTNNLTSEVNCADGIDDDGDGHIDCDDQDCDSSPDCADTCGVDTIFFDNAEEACPTGSFCSANNSQHEPVCTEDAMSASGTNYGDCGDADECPVGAACINSACMPYCDQDTHPDCPGVGVCVFTLTGTEYNLCGILDACTIYPDSCANASEGCYPYADTTVCATAGTLTVGDACASVNECAPGTMCILDSTCHKVCEVANGDADCESPQTQCVGFTDSAYGYCKAP